MEYWIRHPKCNKYEISNLGRVRYYNTKEIKVFNKLTPDGYIVAKCRGNGIIYYRLHKLILDGFKPISNDNKELNVNHIDGDKLNNSLENLEWVNRKQNMRHAFKNGLYKNTYRCELKDTITNNVLYYNTLREIACEIKSNSNYLLSKIKRSDKYPIYGRYNIKIKNYSKEIISGKKPLKVYCIDRVNNKFLVYDKLADLVYDTGLKYSILSNKLKRTLVISMLGYDISLYKFIYSDKKYNIEYIEMFRDYYYKTDKITDILYKYVDNELTHKKLNKQIRTRYSLNDS